VTERVAFQAEREGNGVLASEEALSAGNIQIIGALAGAAVLNGCGGGTETTSAPAPATVSISLQERMGRRREKSLWMGCSIIRPCRPLSASS